MNSYLYNAWLVEVRTVTVRSRRGDYQTLSTFDAFRNLIVNAESEEAGRKILKKYLTEGNTSGEVHVTHIRKIFGAPILNTVFTEEGQVPLDWENIHRQMQAFPETQDCDPGYWLDVNDVVKPNLDFETFFLSLPDDLRSGLNWADDKQFLFLLNVLSRHAPQTTSSGTAGSPGEMDPDEPTLEQLRAQQATCPQLVEKEMVVVIRARNAAVASWLWRNHAANTPLATNAIRIDPVFSGPIQIPAEEA